VSRILLVEDDRKLLEQLEKLIREKVEGVLIDVALNVPQAHQFLDQAYQKREPYDVVVLDLKLPPKAGLTAELDETICKSLKTKMPKALVAHITAYDKDEEVKTHLEMVHDQQPDRSFRLKKVKGFPLELINRLKRFLYGLRIEEKLNRLFDGESDMGYTFDIRPRDSIGSRSVTHELADLTREISSHWKDLDASVQERIKESFNVTVDGEKVTVSLF